jgi:hypothetical protein
MRGIDYSDNGIREEIVRKMLHRQWRPGHSARDLAERTGKSPRLIQKLAYEASRAVSITANVQGVVASKILELDTIIERAMSKVDQNGEDASDLKAAIAAIRVQLEAYGAIGARRKQTAADGEAAVSSDEYAKMSPQERIAKHLDAIEEEKSKLEVPGGEMH